MTTATASIRRRTMRVVMTTTLVALLLSASALLLYELQSHRKTWVQDLRTQAELVAHASAPALSFDDARVAQENLALLSLRPQIEAAAIYDADGRLVAAYARPPQQPAAPAQLQLLPQDAAFDGERLQLQQPIEQAAERLGTMVLNAHYDVLPRLLDYLAILATVSLASLALAALVARRLQSTITDPVVAVSEVAREVMQTRNYTLRAPRTTDDEVGALVEAFNEMLHELGGQAASLQASDRRKDEFLATLAHELRNPLAPVSTALAILARDETDAATKARLVAMMQRQMQQFVRLIDDLMEVSRLSTGRLSLRTERLDLVEVVRAAVEIVAPSLLARRHTLEVQWPPPLWLQGDRTRLGQVFVNLLGNAAKYTDPGGRITITFVLLAESVRVQVADNGLGIAPEMLDEVFEMFVQVERSPVHGRAGLGVGLPLARQLVELHQGTLTLHSDGLGQGSTFTVELPRRPGPQAKDASGEGGAGRLEATDPGQRAGGGSRSDGARAAAGRPLHILLADDNRDFADSLATALKAAGHRVQVTYDGAAALRAATAEMPDVGLFDLGMPRLDGWDLAAAVRDLPGGGRCRLMAITGWAQQSDQLRALAAGYDDHLVKPVDTEALLRCLARHRGHGG